MKNLITIVTNDSDFCKQITQLFPITLIKGSFEHLSPGSDLSHARMVITDGSDESVYDEGVPTFVIANHFPKNIRESASVRFYKRGAFSPEIFVKDVLEWAEIVNALENASEDVQLAEKREKCFKEKLDDYEKNMQMASNLQKDIMTPNAPQDFDIATYYNAVAMVSGDILVVEEIGDRIFVVIGDVTDHGYLAGLYGASLYAAIKGYLSLASQFSMTLEGLVQYVQHASSFYQPDGYGSVRQKTSATMLFCEINKKEQVIHFVNCGHGNELPVLVDSNGNARLADTGNMLPVIGDFSVIPPTMAVTAPFTPGSCLICYTDGITEVFKDANKKDAADEYSSERLLSSVRHEVEKKEWTARSVLEGVRKDAESYSISTDLTGNALDDILDSATDDVTVMVLKWGKYKGDCNEKNLDC